MTSPLLPQQTLMVQYLMDHPVAYLAVCPGLGKSRAVLEALQFWVSDRAIKGALIIAPKFVSMLVWPDEISRWTPGLSVANLRTPEGLKAWDEGSADCYTINFEMLQQFTERCLKRRRQIPVDVLIVDEISKAKSHQSVRMKALWPHLHFFKKRIGLSGTPTPNSALDLWGQLRILDDGKRLGDSFHRFRAKYAESDFMGYSWAMTPGSDEMIQDKIKDVMLVLRASEYMDIPDTTIVDVEVKLPPEAMVKYRKMQKEFLIEIEKKEVVSITAAALVSKLSQMSSGAVYHQDTAEERGVALLHDAKIKALAKLHKSIGYKPLLVFNMFQHEVPRILAEMSYAEVFDGNKLDDFNAGKISLMVAHPASMAHGLQLQGACCHVCWFGPTYSSELFQQGNARVARTGQKNPTTIFRLISDAPIDHAISAVLRSKEEGQEALKSALRFIKMLDSAP